MKKRDIGIVRFELSNFVIYCPDNGLPGNGLPARSSLLPPLALTYAVLKPFARENR